jgi:integrase
LYGEKLNADKAREIIASGVADVMAAAGESLPSSTIREWCKRWLEIKEIENERTTHTRYEQAIRVWLEFLGSSADKNLETLTTDALLKFRDYCASKASVGSTNTNLRILRACINSARQQGLIGSNPASLVKSLKERGESKRREMRLEEIQRVLKVCGETDWKGLVLVGLYTGQRLGDCARLTRQQVDLVNNTISFVTQKTGKALSLGLAEPLADYLKELPSVDDPRVPVFHRLFVRLKIIGRL